MTSLFSPVGCWHLSGRDPSSAGLVDDDVLVAPYTDLDSIERISAECGRSRR
ncbi:hypothetical protein [Nonomuraea sediminis]|uniref:hypothetical protein n=1 Tax=Nonomuraea sediminis TaxID=2835864 RepID=UPI001BDCF705|nr:hypothetical protein [Nonomuraea sediminis]